MVALEIRYTHLSGFAESLRIEWGSIPKRGSHRVTVSRTLPQVASTLRATGKAELLAVGVR
jgi:hypothetical protein